jgi:DtxR family transcriptional regulator, Mn-dependent transcriptional regulator
MATSTVEDYLKTILLKSTGDELVSMGKIAEGLGVVPGTVTTMMKSLADQALIEHYPRQGVRLTERGRLIALNVLRKHRLIETFLVSTLKMDWSEVHVEAERLEHAISDAVLDRIDALLGNPETDPHGDPIPSRQGKLDTGIYDTLATCAIDAPVRMVRVTDQSADFLQFAERQKLIPGETIRVLTRTEVAGSVTVQLDNRQVVALGFRQAGSIQVASAGTG